MFDLSAAEKKLQELSQEWRRVRPDPESIVSVVSWQRTMRELRQRQQVLASDGRWTRGPTSVLAIIGKERRETYHSAMIAWLMDPLAPHGFGMAFLNRLLHTAGVPNEPAAWPAGRLHVQCEVVAATSRADIVLTAPDRSVIIENKVDAVEGEEQCNRLYQDFSTYPDPSFIFLSPTGHPPQTATREAAQAFHTLSYSEVRRVLEGVLKRNKEQNNDAPTQSNGTQGEGLSAARSYAMTLRQLFP